MLLIDLDLHNEFDLDESRVRDRDLDLDLDLECCLDTGLFISVSTLTSSALRSWFALRSWRVSSSFNSVHSCLNSFEVLEVVWSPLSSKTSVKG